MTSIIEQSTTFNNLSVKDLLEARDLFHVHLMSKANVVGTAIGRYLIRSIEISNGRIMNRPPKDIHDQERSLDNSEVIDESWPCILVFVDHWVPRSKMSAVDLATAIPPAVYMPDGRVVPLCVVASPYQPITNPSVDENKLYFPNSAIGGGYPLLLDSQGIEKIATAGCIVTDGNKYYVLTNRHVTGTAGETVYSRFQHRKLSIGKSSTLSIGNQPFQSVYEGWPKSNLFINVDAGLVEIADINRWKTDIYGLGKLGQVVDVNTSNISLKLIGLPVSAHGAVSGRLDGRITALFYRYKSIGGYEYVADFLVGPAKGQKSLKTRHGDSGAVWAVESNGKNGTEFLPIAIQWGQRSIIGTGATATESFALASNLSHICRDLDLDIVRGWNMDLDYTWGKSGHFKIGFGSTLVVTNTKLKKLLTANDSNIGISDDDLIARKVPPGMTFSGFIPMADVADMYWRNARPDDESNHFADMDAKNPQVYNNQSLLDLCFDSHGAIVDTWVDIGKWLDFYQKMDNVDPETTSSGQPRPRLGGLPFRVWEMYNWMVNILKGDDPDDVKLVKFICAGGTMSHYVGDACQPLHISYLHDGYPNGQGKGVHSAYETQMLDTYERKPNSTFLSDITGLLKSVKNADLITGGKNAAKAVLGLMYETYQLMPPQSIVDDYVVNRSVKHLFGTFGGKTEQTIANGIHTMGVLWQSAWTEGNGDALNTPIVQVSQDDLMRLYKDKTFVPSYKLSDPQFRAECQ